MIEFSRVYELTSEICDNITIKDNKIITRCPICGDSQKTQKKKRLRISPYNNTWMCYCWNGGCEVKGLNFYSFYSLATGLSYSEAKTFIDNNTYNSSLLKKKLKKPKKKEKQSVSIEYNKEFDIDFKNECITLDDKPNGILQDRLYNALQQFIKDRYIPDYKLYVAFDGKYKGRIIIPIIINNKIVYYQGRAVTDIEPKYLNPEIEKESIISNSDKFNKEKSIILTEGIIDSWMIEDNQGTTFLGSHVNDCFLEKLFKMTDKDVIIVWDNLLIDKAAQEEIENFFDNSIYKKRVKYFLPSLKNFKDLNDLKILKPSLNMYDYVIKNSYSYYNTVIKLKLL
jgi:hypothetical protein